MIFWGVSVDATLGAKASAAVEIGEPCSATNESAWDGGSSVRAGLEESANAKAARTSVNLFIFGFVDPSSSAAASGGQHLAGGLGSPSAVMIETYVGQGRMRFNRTENPCASVRFTPGQMKPLQPFFLFSRSYSALHSSS